MTKKNGKQGYTLIELLLVIAILAVLVSILFAVFAPVRKKSLEATCINNLRQIGLALNMYRQDYDGADPNGKPMTAAELGLPLGRTSMRVLLHSYLKHDKNDRTLYRCPIGYRYREFDKTLTSNYGMVFRRGEKRFRDQPLFSESVEKYGNEVALITDPHHGAARNEDWVGGKTKKGLILILALNGSVRHAFLTWEEAWKL